ncbi:MAG: folate family ECF transporter S component [Oscillospiraceae bacterium]|nr:folate family ECF transporter S component [Oscillospiraceae bacterium]
MSLFSSPFSRAYWRAAAAELKNLRALVFCALMIAAAIALGLFSIPVADNLKISVSFLARALAAAVGGPVLGVLYGAAEDVLGWVIHPGGPFFPGYTLNTVLAVAIYALFFYRQRITVWRVAAAKVLTNYPVNVGLGCLWSHMLYGKGYLYYAATSVVKNTLYLPVQILLLYMLLQGLLPSLRRTRLLSPEHPDRITWK